MKKLSTFLFLIFFLQAINARKVTFTNELDRPVAIGYSYLKESCENQIFVGLKPQDSMELDIQPECGVNIVPLNDENFNEGSQADLVDIADFSQELYDGPKKDSYQKGLISWCTTIYISQSEKGDIYLNEMSKQPREKINYPSAIYTVQKKESNNQSKDRFHSQFYWKQTLAGIGIFGVMALIGYKLLKQDEKKQNIDT